MWGWLFVVGVATLVAECRSAGAGAARLVCYSERQTDVADCTHLIYTGVARGDKLDTLLKEYRKNNPRVKIILRVSEVDKDLRSLVMSKYVSGLELHDAHRTLNRSSVIETVEAARAAINAAGGGPLFLALPAHPELLAKYYDLHTLVKKVDLMMVQTHALGLVKKMTYHPSRLSGLWDMMNTDSVVDLVVGLGVPASKIVISLPATARQFHLLNETLSTPGSPTTEDEPKEIDQGELCRQLQKGRWTLERDQDLSAPYAFKDKTWISFEDSSSVDVKGKYARVRGLAGLALHQADRDTDTPCGPSLKTALAKVLNQQSRAPRAAVLRSLEHEILSAPTHARVVDALQVSPYRITQVVDSDGVIHSIREDTRTEFSCSRQGYFVHPRSCARFYRCVKFDQLSPEYTVFEFDCPAGLAFDSRYEVCVWPGSLPHSQACPGSSEIAPALRTLINVINILFLSGYYADPENCRWFFACLDHGKAPLTAYEFRCPFGLGFDADKLKCDWPWLVPACGNIARYEAEAYGFGSAALTGANGFQGQTADSINIAAHQSLVSGASLDNLVGIQNGFLSHADALDSNFIASQEAGGFQVSHGNALAVGDANANPGFVQPTKYTSGSLILDDYRLPTKQEASHRGIHGQFNGYATGSNGQYNGYSGSLNLQKSQYQSADYDADNSGAYVHDPTGDYAEPYRHEDAPAVPYTHSESNYKSSDYYDVGRYSGSQDYNGQYQYQGQNEGQYQAQNEGQYHAQNEGQYQAQNEGLYQAQNEGQYNAQNEGQYQGQYKSQYQTGNQGLYQAQNEGQYHGQYAQDNSGAYVQSGSNNAQYSGAYNADYSGSYIHDDSGKYVAGVYRADGHIGNYGGQSSANIQHGSYSSGNSGYLSDSKAYTGASHTLTAGAVNVGLVGKTTLVDAGYNDQLNYNSASNSFGHNIVHQYNNGHVPIIQEPSVSINHVGTDGNNLDGYSFVTTPTSSGVPTTATPFAVTTAIPITTYRTTFVPEAPKTDIKQVFGYTQPAVTYVQPTVTAVKQYVTPKVQVTDYNQGVNYQASSTGSGSSGYVYSKPSIKFEEGVTYATQVPIVVSTFKPQGFSHNQQTVHNVVSNYDYSSRVPVTEEPFKKVIAYNTCEGGDCSPQPTGQSFSHQTIHQTNEYLPPAQQGYNYEAPKTVVAYAQPTVASYTPQTFSHQTIHKVESSNAYIPPVENTYKYSKPTISFEQPKTVVEHTTAQPVVVTTFQPQGFSHQTLHKVDASQVKTYSDSGYKYEKPSGYEYPKPNIKFEDAPKTVIQYTTPAPVVSTYEPQTYSHQTIHKIETQSYIPVTSTPAPVLTYHQPAISVYQNPILQYTENVTPVSYVQPTAQSFSHQTIHKVESNKYISPVEVQQTGYNYEAPKKVVEYTTAQPVVTTTYRPQVYSHQTLHKVEASKVNADSGYQYEQPAVKFEESPKTVIQYTTPAPAIVSTYQPQTYSHQTYHNIKTQKYIPETSTPAPNVELTYHQPAVSVYENPILKFTQNVTPVPTYTPIIQQHEVNHIVSQPVGIQFETQQNVGISQEGYSYSQPEIQRDLENTNAAKSYSDASQVSHQVYHQYNTNKQETGKNVVFVSTTPSTLVYEDHYSDYESPKYKAQEYIPPRTDYQQTYSVSTVAPPVVHQSEVYHQTQDHYDYSQPGDYSQQNFGSVSFSTSHVEQPKVESVHFSSIPEIQVEHKAEDYLPPVVSTVATPIVTSTYKPRVYSTTTREYLPPTPQPTVKEYLPPQPTVKEYLPPQPTVTAYLPPQPTVTVKEYLPPQPTVKEYLPPQPTVKEYLPPKVTTSYLPPSTTARPKVKFSTQAATYLPPQEENIGVVNFESYGFRNNEESNINYNSFPEYTVSSTPKVNLLGFGTVGPDAGLVSSVTYTTASPVSSSYLPPVRRIRPKVKSTTQAPEYLPPVQSTTFKAPEYLPPVETETNLNFGSFGLKNTDQLAYNPYQEQVVVSTSAPLQRKQNIVVQTAKANLLGFGTVGSEAGLISEATYSTAAPIVSSTESFSVTPKVVTSTYAPIKQELVEVSPVPVRRTKPKVAVVTKINDFNPLLVRKLGAVCSCQSPVLILKGKRPNVQVQQEYDDYSNDNDYEDGRGDIGNEWALKSDRLQAVKTVTTAPTVTSTFNPIIVPDDSFYQDIQDSSIEITPKSRQVYSEEFVSSTPVYSTTERIVKIRPRVKAVTVAPTYKTVVLNQEVAPNVVVKDTVTRGRDDLPDCQRAGLFRHPKYCNKFYACRWDCNKQKFTVHTFNCPVQLSFDSSIGACNWPSQGPACQGDTLLTNSL
ncbi:uncharacterized protein LOC126369292 [Pectinophora gossypiella]|uniref:uncharacterized protein LOC126369292 n=1 Tax=Pectinophora gossypiella TaxID=13191 RepID=UPI00214F13D8|nr:uncharacterized protein LOC126369292 [Pectinophora gossypiella]